MARVKFLLKSNKNPSKIYVRFYHTGIDACTPTNLLINPDHWNNELEEVRNIKTAPNRLKYNNILNKLKSYIIDEFVLDYSQGIEINTYWLKTKVYKHFNQPEVFIPGKIKKESTYVYDFGIWWMENKASKYISPTTKRKIGKRSLDHYSSFLLKVKKFDAKHGKMKFHTLTREIVDRFKESLSETEKYATSTVNKNLNRLQFIVNRAQDEKIKVSENFKINYLEEIKSNMIMEPYFTEKQLYELNSLTFEKDSMLDAAKDYLIIGCCTGLRVSDYLTKLSEEHIKDEYIEILMHKTQRIVTVPLHDLVKNILIKRNGKLPPKMAEPTFNKLIKEIASKLGDYKIDFYGGLMDKGLNRKVFKNYPKWKLVSSHIGRRSFATNHYGKIPNIVLMNIGGWKSEEMMLRYLKTSSREFADILNKYWNEKSA